MQGPAWTEAQRQARLAKLVARNRSAHNGQFLYEDVTWMRDAYLVRGLSLREVAAEAGCGLRTASRWMRIHGIETRKKPPRQRRAGADHPQWKGGPKRCPLCGGKMSAGASSCARCRDRTGAANPKWRGDAAEYTAVHQRLIAQRGKPSGHACAHCGREAAEWAYDHSDPGEVRNRVGRDDGAFSLDPAHYVPLCVRCHRRFDRT